MVVKKDSCRRSFHYQKQVKVFGGGSPVTRVLFNSQITVGPLVVPGENDFYINVGLTGRQTNFSLKERSLSLLSAGGRLIASNRKMGITRKLG